MSFRLKIDPKWYVEQVLDGKTDEQILETIDEMIDASLRRSAQRMQEEIKKMLATASE